MVAAVDFSPIDPLVQADPYPWYAELRRGPAAMYLPGDDLWVVSRFESVRRVARQPELFSSKALHVLAVGGLTARNGPRPDIRELDTRMSRSLIASDPPDHTRLRRLVSQPFSPRSIGMLREQIGSICEDVVGDLLEAGTRDEADLVGQVAFPLPVRVIAAALGIPGERQDDFKRWSNALVGRLDGQSFTESAVADIAEMTAYFHEVVGERTAEPGDDLVSWIIAGAAKGDDVLTARDLVSFATLLLVAGNETTTNLLGNAYDAFFQHPAQYERVMGHADLGRVIEEVLRYDAPVQGIVRVANDEVDLGDVVIPRDAVVMILFGSANRDETRWADANVFDVDREPQDHLGFGSGIHLCLGAHLARLEATIALDVLRSRVAVIEPRGPATRLRSAILRGFTAMPVHVEPTT
jgi:cytochrome P450